MVMWMSEQGTARPADPAVMCAEIVNRSRIRKQTNIAFERLKGNDERLGSMVIKTRDGSSVHQPKPAKFAIGLLNV